MTRMQWRVVILGWITYASFYFGRVNIAGALPTIENEFGWTPDQTGVLVGASLVTYAIGQLVNGWLGERFDARKLVFTGLLGSSIINIAFAVVAAPNALLLLIALWLVNGLFQSMGWGPILRTLSDNLLPDQRRRISGVFGSCYVVGNTVTWALTALLLSIGQWRLAFIVPAALMLGLGALWYLLSADITTRRQTDHVLNLTAVLPVVSQIMPVVLTALIAGALINGALLFAPSFAAEYLPIDQAALAAAVFPICGLVGTIWLGGGVMRRFADPLASLTILLVLNALARALQFVLPPSAFTSMVLLAAMGITSYALTNILLTAVPLLSFEQLGTSMVAGIIDATHSVGGAFGSALVGVLLARGGWHLVFMAWTLLPLMAIGIVATIHFRQVARLPRV